MPNAYCGQRIFLKVKGLSPLQSCYNIFCKGISALIPSCAKTAVRALSLLALVQLLLFISPQPILAGTNTDLVTLPPLLPGEESILIAEGAIGEGYARVYSTLAVVPADGETEAELAIRIADADGSPVVGKFLSLSFKEGDGFLIPQNPITDENGEAVFTYRAGKLAITNTVSILDVSTGASFDFVLPTSLSAVLTVELVDPVEYQRQRSASILAPDVFNLELFAFPDVLVADGLSISRLTARLTYKDGRPASGFPIAFRIASGFGRISQESRLTNGEGVIEAVFQASERVGNVLVEAVEQTTGKRAIVEIAVLKAGPAKLKLFFADSTFAISENKAVIPADGVTRIELIAQVLSLADTPVSGVRVDFKLKNFLGSLEVPDSLTGASGEVHAFFIPATTPGLEEITAFVISALQPE